MGTSLKTFVLCFLLDLFLLVLLNVARHLAFPLLVLLFILLLLLHVLHLPRFLFVAVDIHVISLLRLLLIILCGVGARNNR